MWDVGGGMRVGHASTIGFLAFASPKTPTPALPKGRGKNTCRLLKHLPFTKGGRSHRHKKQTSPSGEVAKGRRGVVQPDEN